MQRGERTCRNVNTGVLLLHTYKDRRYTNTPNIRESSEETVHLNVTPPHITSRLHCHQFLEETGHFHMLQHLCLSCSFHIGLRPLGYRTLWRESIFTTRSQTHSKGSLVLHIRNTYRTGGTFCPHSAMVLPTFICFPTAMDQMSGSVTNSSSRTSKTQRGHQITEEKLSELVRNDSTNI